MSEQRNVQRSACFACGQTFAPNEHHACGGLSAQAGADNTTVEQSVVYDPRKAEIERLRAELAAERQQAEDALEAQQALGLRLGQVERQAAEARAEARRFADLLDEGMQMVRSLAEDRTLLLGILDEYRDAHCFNPGVICQCELCAKVEQVHQRIREAEQEGRNDGRE